MDISTLLNLINYIFVLIFGIIVSFYFADIRLEDNHKLFIYTTLTFALFQAVCYLLLGQNVRLILCVPQENGSALLLLTFSKIFL